MDFRIASDLKLAGDQSGAVRGIVEGLSAQKRYQTLKGVTGSGKTFTMAKIIERCQRPALVLSHNKTLAAQLFREFKQFFPDNAVEYFVSYYDYYQPEAYVAKRDLYIEKDADINSEIDKLRNSATVSLMERPDVIVVATVSCIYGLGNPRAYKDMRVRFALDQTVDLAQLKLQLTRLQYTRTHDTLEHGSFRVRGDVIEIYPVYADKVYRVELEWDEVQHIRIVHSVTAEILEERDEVTIYPSKHFVIPEDQTKRALQAIREELTERVHEFERDSKVVEAQRLNSRTLYDIEMVEEMGYCSGIENYSRHFAGREPGSRPSVLLDYFPDNFITFIDESHVSLPQLRAMYIGDRSRKESLVQYGFRLPSALDNRPLYYEEFEGLARQIVYVSATPGNVELHNSGPPIEQIIRPTGLVDPEIELFPTEGQIEHLYASIQERVAASERVLVTTLTKKLAERLTDYFAQMDVRVRYIHSEIDTLVRTELLTDLRAGKYDVLVGINLLREGLDLPEVSLVAIMDADKIGFLRSATALIQTIGRAARNINGRVYMYADKVSSAMHTAIDETNRRRTIQREYNKAHSITPYSIRKDIQTLLVREKTAKVEEGILNTKIIRDKHNVLVAKERRLLIKELERAMLEHAKRWEFEQAATVRDEIARLKKGEW